MLLVFPIGRWIFSSVPRLYSRQPKRISLFCLLVVLSVVHVSLPAQAGVEAGGIDPAGVAVVLAQLDSAAPTAGATAPTAGATAPTAGATAPAAGAAAPTAGATAPAAGATAPAAGAAAPTAGATVTAAGATATAARAAAPTAGAAATGATAAAATAATGATAAAAATPGKSYPCRDRCARPGDHWPARHLYPHDPEQRS